MKKLTPYIVTTILVLIIALTGCGGGGGGVTWPQCYAYVANSGSANVTAYSIDSSTGKLTAIGTINSGTEPCSIITDPAGNYVYVVNRSSNSISIFSINAFSGQLAQITGSPVATIYKPGAITMNPNPNSVFIHAYVANTDASIITPYSTEFYNSSGKLTVINGLNPISCGSYSCSITADPTGKFVYVANRDSSSISAFKINLSNGDLIAINGSPISNNSNPISIVVDPTGQFVYVANYGSDNVTAYSITPSTGALGYIGNYSAGTDPYSITVDPSGRFAYVANMNSNNISAYSIGTKGVLTAISRSPFDNGSGTSPISVTVDPTGRFAYVVNNFSDNIQAYAITNTGALTPVGNPVAAGHWPVSMITVRK